MSTLKFATIPQKRLLAGITSASTSFYLNNILSFDGVTDLTSADFGSIHYCAFRNDTGTILELMEIDPSTITAGGAITINKRGLSFYGDLTTEDTDLKLDWPTNTVVMLGTDVPQIFQWLKEYVDNTAFAGAPDASETVKGIVEEATDAQIIDGTDAGETGARLFPVPSKMNTQIQAKIVTDRVRTTTTTSSATPSINVDTYNRLTLTAQADNITSMSSGLSGTPTDGQKLQIRITPAARTPAISYVAQYNTNITGASLTLTKPTGTVDGDIMFAVFYSQSGDPGYYGSSIPAGWTKISGNINERNLNMGSYYVSVYYKLASSEPADYTFTQYTSMTWWGQITTFRGGFNTVNPFQNISAVAYATNDTINRAASFGVAKQYAPMIFIGLNSSQTSTPPSGFTEVYDAIPYQYTQYAIQTNSSYGATGNIDATLAGATTDKIALCIALNPELDVTWGSSYSEIGMDLPTKIYSPNSTTIDFTYNSLSGKWETVGEDSSRISDCNIGIQTKDISGTTTTSIAHGLGKAPNLVRIKTLFSTSSGIFNGETIYNPISLTQKSIYNYLQSGTGTGEGSGYSTAFRIGTDEGNTNYIEGTITVDSVNINITWVKTNTPTGTANLLWEAFI